MYKPLKFITEITYKGFSTFYMFCKETKTLLPVEISGNLVNNVAVPSIYNSIKRILIVAGYSISGIKIYYEYENTFYTYLTIKKGKISLDINLSFNDAVEISKETSAPIYVNEKILERTGIKVTKKLLTEALKNKIT